METLDEVILTFAGCFLQSRKEWCIENCPYLQNDEQMCRRDVLTDALHYLREYQRDKQIFAYDVARRNFELSERNDPLTWQELTQMKGKPVWDEGKTVKHWTIITGIYYDDLNEGYVLLTYYSERNGAQTIRRKRSTMGKTWNAYRKERE